MADPFVYWYTADFLNECADLELEDSGAYAILRSLMAEKDGPIEDDRQWLARRCNVTTYRFGRIRKRLLASGLIESRSGMLAIRARWPRLGTSARPRELSLPDLSTSGTGPSFYEKLDELTHAQNRLQSCRAGERVFHHREIRQLRLELARMRGTHAEEEWLAIVEEFSGRCAACESGVRIEKDHIVPLYQGGCDCAANLQPLCRRCNAAKGADRTDWKAIRRAERKIVNAA